MRLQLLENSTAQAKVLVEGIARADHRFPQE
jgi:hypothetical protein